MNGISFYKEEIRDCNAVYFTEEFFNVKNDGSIAVKGDLSLTGDLNVQGDVSLTGSAQIVGNLFINGKRCPACGA